jgi:23S rRNA (adenine2503-C2)-methyltransferase
VDLEALEAFLGQRAEPAYRAGQIWRWAAAGAPGYDAMTNVPAALRATLAEMVPFSTLAVEREVESRDGTVKTLFRTADGKPVEAVLMRYRDGRRSICVSSQSGCPLTCTFCATGQMRFGRNLTAAEIVDQALHFRRIESIDHCVFMGMGEPMLNLGPVLAAARRLPDIGITHRRTTISTVGWLPGLRRFVDEVEEPIRLALSLHAAEPGLRSQLMPVNDRYPLADVLAECRRYVEKRGRKVFVEYVMLSGVNDRVEQAGELARALDPKSFKVNLIPYNPTGAFAGSSRAAIAAFKAVLDRAGIPATVRLTRGRDIDGESCVECPPLARRRASPGGAASGLTVERRRSDPGAVGHEPARFLEQSAREQRGDRKADVRADDREEAEFVLPPRLGLGRQRFDRVVPPPQSAPEHAQRIGRARPPVNGPCGPTCAPAGLPLGDHAATLPGSSGGNFWRIQSVSSGRIRYGFPPTGTKSRVRGSIGSRASTG